MTTHIYHYNVSAEQRYFLGPEHHNLYDLIFINGNIVSHTPAGIAGFVSTANKKFFIDPQTHSFQHATIHLKRDVSDKEKGEPPKFEFKPSIKKLANHLGSPFTNVIDNDRPLSYRDFLTKSGNLDEKLFNQVCKKVIDFQQKILEKSLDDEAKELLSGSRKFRPKFVISPYFYLSPNRCKEWLKISVSFYKKAKKIVKDTPVYFFLVVSKEALVKNSGEITKKLKDLKPDGVILWIDEHKEESLLSNDIDRFIKLLKNLRDCTKTIYNSHGGYLSILLCTSEAGNLLDGVGHSINYGESRSVVPIGGGIPMARFYFPSIHSRLRYGDALGIVLSQNWLSTGIKYRNNVCKCAQCLKLIKSKKTINDAFLVYGESYPVTFRRRSGTIVSLEYPTTEAKQVAACHYLYNKAKEFKDIKNISFKELLKNLTTAYDAIAPISGDSMVAHMYKWRTALQKPTKK